MKRIVLLLLTLLCLLTTSADLYDTTNLTNAENMYEQTLAVNLILDGIVGIGLVAIAFSITFFAVARRTGDALSAVLGGSFIGLFSVIFLLPLGLVGESVFTIVLLIFALSLSARLIIKTY